MPDHDMNDLCARLDRITRLVAVSLTSGKTQSQQCLLLQRAGFQPKEIAGLIGTSPNTVSVTLSKLRRRKVPNGASGPQTGEKEE